MNIDMRAVQSRHTEDEIQAAVRAMREAPTYSQGDELKAFEAEFADYMQAPSAMGVSSATAALELVAIMSRIGPGDEVVLPAHTFVSTAVPFARTGARVVWADIDPGTRTVTADTISECLSTRTKLVVAVHLYGLCADIGPIAELCRKRNLLLVEDCAQAPGAQRGGRKAGTFGDFSCFSFHTQKNMTTLGEGGMLLCRNPEHDCAARKMRWMGNWPFETPREKYWVPAMGNLVEPLPGVWPVNCCVGEIQCAVGRIVLRRLDAINTGRRRQADRFRTALADCRELVFQKVDEPLAHIYHLMTAEVRGVSRDDLIDRLNARHGIKCIVQYLPLYRAPLFKALGCGDASCPNSDRFFDHMISFPWWTDMPDEVLDYMAKATGEEIAGLRARL